MGQLGEALEVAEQRVDRRPLAMQAELARVAQDRGGDVARQITAERALRETALLRPEHPRASAAAALYASVQPTSPPNAGNPCVSTPQYCSPNGISTMAAKPSTTSPASRQPPKSPVPTAAPASVTIPAISHSSHDGIADRHPAVEPLRQHHGVDFEPGRLFPVISVAGVSNRSMSLILPPINT